MPFSRAASTIARASGCAEPCSSAAATPSRSWLGHAGDVDPIGQAGPALRDRARLVEQDERDPARLLDRLGVAEEDSGARAPAGADEDRRRRGEAERAGAGDDQDRRERDRREERARLGADDVPGDPGRDGDRQDDRNEDAGDPVGELLDRRLGGLRLLDEPRDLRERRPAADGGRRHVDRTVDVSGTADDAVARALFDGKRLARDHRLVHRRAARPHDAVDRDRVARLDAEQVADRHLGERHLAFDAVAHAPRHPRREIEQPAHRGGRLAPRPRLEVAPEQDEREDHADRLVVDVSHRPGGDARKGRRKQRRGQRETERRRRADRDERVHVGRAVAQRSDGARKKRRSGPEVDRQREREQDPVAARKHEVRHRDDRRRNREGGRHERAPQDVARFGAAARLLFVGAGVERGPRVVAARPHGGHESVGVEIRRRARPRAPSRD